MKIKYCLLIICSLIMQSCHTGGKDNLAYDLNMPLETKTFYSGRIKVDLPELVVVHQPSLPYSNAIRTKWAGTGFINHYPITNISIYKDELFDQTPLNSLRLRRYYDIERGDNSVFREGVILLNECDVFRVIVATLIDPQDFFNNELVTKYVKEDNTLFLRIIKTIRVRDESGGWLKIDVDDDKFHEQFRRMSENKKDFEQVNWLIELIPAGEESPEKQEEKPEK